MYMQEGRKILSNIQSSIQVGGKSLDTFGNFQA